MKSGIEKGGKLRRKRKKGERNRKGTKGKEKEGGIKRAGTV